MINLSRISGNLTNKKVITLKKDHLSHGRDFHLIIYLDIYEEKIRVHSVDYDVEESQKSDDGPNDREEFKYFKTVKDAVEYILKTTIITEVDFPAKYQQRVSKEAKK